MPTYITRTIQEYPTEFYRCPANPEGFEFTCIFCMNFYKTKSACISHMEKCCRDEDTEYDRELEVEEGVTVYDYQSNHAVKSSTIKHYITTNELVSLSELPSTHIIERIQARLIENGFNGEEFYLYNASFLIYKFFFVASEEEKATFRRMCAERIITYL